MIARLLLGLVFAWTLISTYLLTAALQRLIRIDRILSGGCPS